MTARAMLAGLGAFGALVALVALVAGHPDSAAMAAGGGAILLALSCAGGPR